MTSALNPLRQAFHTTLAVMLSLHLALAFALTGQSAFDHTQAPTGDKIIEHTVDSSGKFQKTDGVETPDSATIGGVTEFVDFVQRTAQLSAPLWK